MLIEHDRVDRRVKLLTRPWFVHISQIGDKGRRVTRAMEGGGHAPFCAVVFGAVRDPLMGCLTPL
jgi:hypothetical protein